MRIRRVVHRPVDIRLVCRGDDQRTTVEIGFIEPAGDMA